MATYNFFILFVFLITHLYSTCGFQRIVGGTETTIEQRPYTASIQYNNGATYVHRCGAAIISTKHVLTSAQCNPGSNMPLYYVFVGSTSYQRIGQFLKIVSFETHPNFDRFTLDYDFAIVSFESHQEIILGSNAAIVQLPETDDPDDGNILTVSGWGVTSESATNVPLNLREVDLPVFNQERCNMIYSYLTPRHICLGGTPEGGIGACFGDTGGPAVKDGVLYAIVSGGDGCSSPNIPGIYSRISTIRSWITDLTGV